MGQGYGYNSREDINMPEREDGYEDDEDEEKQTKLGEYHEK